MMDKFIGNIFYFGCPMGGFKTYPDPEPNPHIFAGYNDNTPKGWMLIAKKEGGNTRYTYVLYGLWTAMEGERERRSGSCLGISIEFIGHYFTNLNILLNEIEIIFKALIEEDRKLVGKTASGDIGFKVENFTDVREYLDDKSQKIRKVITKQYLKYIRPSDEIPESESNSIPAYHPKSSYKVLNEVFESYGAIILSPNGRLEKRSESEKAEEDKRALEIKCAELEKQLKQKDIDLQSYKQMVDLWDKIHNSIINTLAPTLLEQKSNPIDPAYATSQESGLFPNSIKVIAAHNPEGNEPGRKSKYKISQKIIFIVGLIIAILLIVIFGVRFLLTDDKNQVISENTSTPKFSSIATPIQLNPPPNNKLNEIDLEKFNKNLQVGMTASEVANKAIDSNKEDIKKTYDNQREAYTKKLIEVNAGCFDGNTKDFKLTCPELRHIPIYQQSN